MNQIYKIHMEYAYEAARVFFELFEKTGDMKMLQNDDHIRELYLKAHDVAGKSTEEERNFYLEYSVFNEYKAYLMITSGEFAKIMGNGKTFKTSELKPMYDILTRVMDEAIAQNDIYKPFYLKNKAEIISEYNEALEKFGFIVEKDTEFA